MENKTTSIPTTIDYNFTTVTTVTSQDTTTVTSPTLPTTEPTTEPITSEEITTTIVTTVTTPVNNETIPVIAITTGAFFAGILLTIIGVVVFFKLIRPRFMKDKCEATSIRAEGMKDEERKSSEPREKKYTSADQVVNNNPVNITSNKDSKYITMTGGSHQVHNETGADTPDKYANFQPFPRPSTNEKMMNLIRSDGHHNPTNETESTYINMTFPENRLTVSNKDTKSIKKNQNSHPYLEVLPEDEKYYENVHAFNIQEEKTTERYSKQTKKSKKSKPSVPKKPSLKKIKKYMNISKRKTKHDHHLNSEISTVGSNVYRSGDDMEKSANIDAQEIGDDMAEQYYVNQKFPTQK